MENFVRMEFAATFPVAGMPEDYSIIGEVKSREVTSDILARPLFSNGLRSIEVPHAMGLPPIADHDEGAPVIGMGIL
jgi:hypothetical protein